LVFEGNGVIRDFPGNYTQYRASLKDQENTAPKNQYLVNSPAEAAPAEKPVEEKKKLSFKEKRELELLQQEIASLETEKATLTEKLNSGNLPFAELQQASARIGEIAGLLDEKELRWLELSE